MKTDKNVVAIFIERQFHNNKDRGNEKQIEVWLPSLDEADKWWIENKSRFEKHVSLGEWLTPNEGIEVRKVWLHHEGSTGKILVQGESDEIRLRRMKMGRECPFRGLDCFGCEYC